MVLPVSMNRCIICFLSVLILYPTLVVRSISRHTLYLQPRTHSSPTHVHLMDMDLKQFENRSRLSGHSAGLNFFFGIQPQTVRLSLNYGPLIY